MAPAFRKVIYFLACVALSGCASQDLMLKRQAEAEAKIEHLIQSDRKNERQIGDLIIRVQMLTDQNQRLVNQINGLQKSTTELRDFQPKVAAQAHSLTDTKIEVVNQDATARNENNSPPADYLRAFGLYSANNFREAISVFKIFISRFPDSEYMVNAIYWIGECHYALSDFQSSLASFQKVVDSYPNSPKAPDALLKLGYIRSTMGDKNGAKKAFEELVRRYPSSPLTSKARERLTTSQL